MGGETGGIRHADTTHHPPPGDADGNSDCETGPTELEVTLKDD